MRTELKNQIKANITSVGWVSVYDEFMNNEIDVMITAEHNGTFRDDNSCVTTSYRYTYGLGIDEDGEPYTLRITDTDASITLGLNTKMFYAIQFFDDAEISEYFKKLGYK